MAYSDYQSGNGFQSYEALREYAYDDTLKEGLNPVLECLGLYYPEPRELYKLLDSAAGIGDAVAQKYLGYMLITGTYFVRDTEAGLGLLYESSATDKEAKHLLSVYNGGNISRNGVEESPR